MAALDMISGVTRVAQLDAARLDDEVTEALTMQLSEICALIVVQLGELPGFRGLVDLQADPESLLLPSFSTLPFSHTSSLLSLLLSSLSPPLLSKH